MAYKLFSVNSNQVFRMFKNTILYNSAGGDYNLYTWILNSEK